MNDRNDPLIQRAAGLPESIEPGRDLWPDIASQLSNPVQSATKRERAVWPIALAASLTVAVLSSVVTWYVVTRPDLSTERIVELMTDPAQPYVQNVELLNARRELTESLDRSLQRLSPETRRQVSANLLEIHESLKEIRVALAEDPDNIFLHQLLHSTYEQEIGLLSDISRVALTLPEEVET